MMRVVFMGTPAFAVPSLAALLDGGRFQVQAVVTQPDKPSGRGNRLTPCPVKALALARGVPVLQPRRVSGPDSLTALMALAPDVCVTAAFGQILSPGALAVPALGTVNLHASLLPKYRGPAPISWCLMEGEAVTGVTTMMTDPGIDTGDILLSRETPVLPEDTAASLTQRLAELGASLLLETLTLLAKGRCPRIPQDHGAATYYPMLKKEHGRVDWTRPALSIANLVRGADPWPGAWTLLPEGGALKIWRAYPEARDAGEALARPGEIVRADGKLGLAVACGDGLLRIDELQAPGGKRMDGAAFLRGHPLPVGAFLGGVAS